MQGGIGESKLSGDVGIAEGIETADLDQALRHVQYLGGRIRRILLRLFHSVHPHRLRIGAKLPLDFYLLVGRVLISGAGHRGEVVAMYEAEHRAFAQPDEVREFPHGRAEIVKIGNGEVGRYTFEPGWRWSSDVKPIANTASCEAPHFQFHVSGLLAILM